MRVIHVESQSHQKDATAQRRAPPPSKRRESRHPIDPADAHFLASPFVIRGPPVSTQVAVPDDENTDLHISLYSQSGRPERKSRARTPALDVLRDAIARGAQRPLPSEYRLSAHLCPEVPMRYCPEIAFAERSVQKPCSKWSVMPTGQGNHLTRPFPRQLRRRPRSEYARSHRSFDDRSTAAQSAFH
jgi:hypothetical protein